jgi:hypothetical protein
VAQKKQWLVEATVFFYGGALTAEWKVLTDWSSRTEQSHRLERDRLIARIEKLGWDLFRSLNSPTYSPSFGFL